MPMDRRTAEEAHLAVETPQNSWAASAEAAIGALRDVEGASIQVAGDEIREIHVLARSNRPPKQIVRDVQTVLLTRFHRHIDYRVVSVAYLGSDAAAPATAPSIAPRPAAPTAPVRIRFGSVNLFVSGPRTQAQVELKWAGSTRMGSASGWGTRSGAHRLIASATLAAVQQFLAEDLALSAQDVEFLRLGSRTVAVVSVSVLAHRQENTLVGTCTVEQDEPQAVALATLSALNRFVGGLGTREPTDR